MLDVARWFRPAWFATASICLLLAPSAAGGGDPLPGTAPLEVDGDLAAQMVEGIDRFLLRMTADSVGRRSLHWQRDSSSHAAYAKSVEPNRLRLRRIIGAIDERVPFQAPEAVATISDVQQRSFAVDANGQYTLYLVRWPVLAGVWGEGVLFVPNGSPPLADVVALLDPAQAAELVTPPPKGAPSAEFPSRLAAAGCRVLVPTLIDREDAWSAIPTARATNQPHREFIYRQAYEMGRHLIGYEVQKVLSAVDWLAAEREAESAEEKPNHSQPPRRIGVYGYGEGGLIALHAAAIDPRIDVACVSGYFGPREGLWSEPIYRNLWSLLDEFGDAELASLVAPRPLVIEMSEVPGVSGPPLAREGRSGAAPGVLLTPTPKAVQAEAQRARQLAAGLDPAFTIDVHDRSGDLDDGKWSPSELAFAARLDPKIQAAAESKLATPLVFGTQSALLERQFRQLVDYTQKLMQESPDRRAEFWKQADASSIEAWQKSCEHYRRYFYDEVIGRIDSPLLPANPRTRQVYDEPKFVGYEVQLDVFDDVFAYGILLLPKDMKPGERRPIVVCQHGLEGRPQDVADPGKNNPSYNQYACRLAEQGFIAYAPQNPYIGQDKFRTLQRKANPLKLSLFSFIVPQHEQTTAWLASLPMVDPERIAFYGLSYGGKTAMRVPPLVERYCLSICSADFNEWIWKNVSSTAKYSYLATGEYEMFEFDLGNTFNYAEMAGLIAPRPFMVERGHHDGVAPDEWVAYEYAKVRRLYAALKIPERTEIEFFDGPHTIHGVGTFEFLRRHLGWERR